MQHPLITAWARDKFKLPAGVEIHVEEEERSGGYCDTCYHEWTVWVVYQVNGRDRTVLHTWDDDFASIMREIMDYAKEKLDANA